MVLSLLLRKYFILLIIIFIIILVEIIIIIRCLNWLRVIVIIINVYIAMSLITNNTSIILMCLNRLFKLIRGIILMSCIRIFLIICKCPYRLWFIFRLIGWFGLLVCFLGLKRLESGFRNHLIIINFIRCYLNRGQ